MIDSKKIVNSILTMAGLKEQYREIVESQLNAFARYLLSEMKWKFMLASTTDTTVVGTRTYTLTGANNDLAAIHSIRYGTWRVPLQQYDVELFDQERAGSSSDVGEPYGYAITATDIIAAHIFPIIEFLGSPTSVETIYIRYWKEVPSDPFKALPDPFEYFLNLHLAFLWDNDPMRKQGWAEEEERVLFNLHTRYAYMSSQRPELIKETLQDMVRICHVNQSYY